MTFLSHAADHTGEITQTMSATNEHPNLTNQGIVQFRFEAAITTNCTWLYVDKDNATFVSYILSAQAQKIPVKVWYVDDKNTPTGSCLAYTIQLG